MGTSFSSVIIKQGNSVCVSVPEFISLGCPYCVRGTRTQPLICVGCSVQLIREVFFEIAFSSSSSPHICLALRRLLTFCLTLMRCLWKMSATPGACIKQGLARWPMCHKVNLSSYVTGRLLCHKVNLPSCVVRQPLRHRVNLPRCEARRRHLIMTCDIFGTGQTNTLTLCYLLGKTYKPAHSSATLESLKSTRSTKLLEKLLT